MQLTIAPGESIEMQSTNSPPSLPSKPSVAVVRTLQPIITKLSTPASDMQQFDKDWLSASIARTLDAASTSTPSPLATIASPKPKYLDWSVGGYWSPKEPEFFVMTGGHFKLGEGCQVGIDNPYMVLAWPLGGCGEDFVIFRMQEKEHECLKKAFLVVPKSHLQASLYPWWCRIKCFPGLSLIGLGPSKMRDRFGSRYFLDDMPIARSTSLIPSEPSTGALSSSV